MPEFAEIGLGGPAETVDRLHPLTAITMRALEQTRMAPRRIDADVGAPPAANAAGLLTALREGIQ